MEKGNVLVTGNSGVGKPALINAVPGEELAVTSFGTSGATKRPAIYGSKDARFPFRVIDTAALSQPWPTASSVSPPAERPWSARCPLQRSLTR